MLAPASMTWHPLTEAPEHAKCLVAYGPFVDIAYYDHGKFFWNPVCMHVNDAVYAWMDLPERPERSQGGSNA